LLPEISELGWNAVVSRHAKDLTVDSEDKSSFGTAEPCGILNQGVENWLKVKG